MVCVGWGDYDDKASMGALRAAAHTRTRQRITTGSSQTYVRAQSYAHGHTLPSQASSHLFDTVITAHTDSNDG